MGKPFRLLLLTALTGWGVALTYYLFEGAVHLAIDTVWKEWLPTDDQRWLVVPVCLGLSLLYFGVQHVLDSRSEHHESHGLGQTPQPTIQNFGNVLAIGFLSLVAGASLGPEAILVPACTVLGSYIGTKACKANDQAAKLLGAAGFIALFAAFFNSFIAGLLGLLLIRKQTKLRVSPSVFAIAVVAAASTVWLLGLLSSQPFVTLPANNWHFSVRSLVALGCLLLAGYLITYALGWSYRLAALVNRAAAKRPWWQRSPAAASGLATLYLLGGPLVEFTGNESIVPMLQRAAELGVVGLLWLVTVKIAAISWSKAMGYRGGLIFPTVFVASVLVAIAHAAVHDLNFIYGLIAVLIGVLAADRKVNILI